MKLLWTICLVAVLAVATVGCNDEKDYERQNTYNMEHPEVVGTVEGQVIKRIKLDSSSSLYPHFIYFVGNTATENHMQRVGKVSYHRVTVFIDGVTNYFDGTNIQIELNK